NRVIGVAASATPIAGQSDPRTAADQAAPASSSAQTRATASRPASIGETTACGTCMAAPAIAYTVGGPAVAYVVAVTVPGRVTGSSVPAAHVAGTSGRPAKQAGGGSRRAGVSNWWGCTLRSWAWAGLR